MSSIAKVKEYLARFGAAGRVTELDHSSATVELAAQALRTALDAAIVCIHRIGDCIVSGAEETACLPGFPVDVPRISVGAGDTFNGAFLWAVCMDLSPFDAGRFANAATAQFVRSGDLPSLPDVMELLAL